MLRTDQKSCPLHCWATGAPISVPVGENTLGRMFNVLGEPIDEKEAPKLLPSPEQVHLSNPWQYSEPHHHPNAVQPQQLILRLPFWES